ncbi:hypothetical protein Pyrde_0951 [Pyrodictium delaneyi]|uniref:DUF3267 domain-containing protein n=1 Tax=Pyrodictium delaneyi TaxID=1273541 RepID=A0A0P0N363_9CREN|nr:metalloprotease family protein [Pyrodictium delaneyi]ALL00999.1 hypothetical protein Pyrde_0951 [Pyrodictium delaneyi]OWJ55398.1 hypothetical protein Pdsh_00885 [Pyrodictium delaneyi]
MKSAEEKKVIVRRAWSIYAGLVAALATPIIVMYLIAPLCGRTIGCSPGGCVIEVNMIVLAASLASVVVLHELIHMVSARLIGVEGVRLRLVARMGAIMIDYSWMTPRQYLVVALTPQLLSIIALAMIAYGMIRGTLGLALCIAFVFNVSGGMVDIVNAVYFSLTHWYAKRFLLLYSENGGVAGGVVEYDDKLVVYML